MTALSADRSTAVRESALFEGPSAASAECFAGALLVRDASGNIKPAEAAASLIAVGRCEEYALESTAVAAASNVKYRAGTFLWANSAVNTLTKAHIGDVVYIEDDQTVGSSAAATSAAGLMVDIDDNGVWVLTDPRLQSSSGLLAANNLSDVGTAATAAENIGVGVTDSPTFVGLTLTGALTVATTLGVTGAATFAATATKVAGKVGLDFNTCRVHDNLAALLPVAGSTDDLGNVPGTVGTTAPSLQTEDLKAAGATSNIATFTLVVPDWYAAGATLNLVCNAGMITTVSDTTATLDVECWVADYANGDGTVSGDLCGTAAQSINSATFADKTFVIDDDAAGYVLEAGDLLQFRITTAVNDAATGTAVIAAIRKIHLVAST